MKWSSNQFSEFNYMFFQSVICQGLSASVSLDWKHLVFILPKGQISLTMPGKLLHKQQGGRNEFLIGGTLRGQVDIAYRFSGIAIC